MGLYDATIGALLVGTFLNTFLYGLVTYQFAAYYRAKFSDPPRTKYTVLFLFVLDTFHSASAIYMAWYYTVTNYDNPAALTVGIWPYPFNGIGTSLTAVVTQIYLGHRIWQFTDSNILFSVVILLAIPSFILGTVCSIIGWIDLINTDIPLITPISIAWLTMQVFEDAFITTTLTIVFTRSRTGFRGTDTVLNRLIRGAVQTGFFTGVFSICNLITFVMFPYTNLFGIFGIPLGRIYTNTFMDTLLARESLKAELHRTVHASEVVGAANWPTTGSSQTTSHWLSTSSQLQAQVLEETGNPSIMSSGEAKGKVVPPPF